MGNTIDTLEFGILPIAYDDRYLMDIVDCEHPLIEDSQGILYEIRYTMNHKIVAYRSKKLN